MTTACILDHYCPIQLSVIVEMFYTSAVLLSSHKPLLAIEGLKCGYETEELDFDFS